MTPHYRSRRKAALRALIIALLAVAVVVTTANAAPALHFRVFARTGLRLTDILWTGRQFLYVDNTTNLVAAAGPSGAPITTFAQMPRHVEETRCVTASAAYGFTAGDIYCHSPDNKIYRISPNGKKVTVFAVLPHSPTSDGALTFDTVGLFGHTLVAATGRSGQPAPPGGAVFTIDSAGAVHRVGRYPNPGGADEMAIAPSHFGSVSGEVLLPVDAGHSGSLVAMDARGHARTLLQLPDGPNPIAVLERRGPPAGAARPGLYVTDTTSNIVYFASAAQLKPYAGSVLVGSELKGLFWAVQPRGGGFVAHKLSTNLNGKQYNLEAATYLAG